MDVEDENKNLDRQENDTPKTDKVEETKPVEDNEPGKEDEDPSNDEEEGSSSDSDEEQSSEKDEDKQDAVQKRINKIHKEKKEAEEKAALEHSRRVELEKKLSEATKETLPPIPAIPDYMDADYAGKMKLRDELIVKHAKAAADRDALTQIKMRDLQLQQKVRVDRVNAAVAFTYKTAKEAKIDKDTFDSYQNTVVQYIQGKPELAMYLLEDGDGVTNVAYLAQNLEELDKISKMSETKAAVYIAQTITPKAKKLLPKQSKTPKPPNYPRGNHRVKSDDPFLGGATFE